MRIQIETASMDNLTVRLFETIDERNMPWILAADGALRKAFGTALLELVPSYTTLLLHYDLQQMTHDEARRRIVQALDGLEPIATDGGRRHEIPVWYDESVGPELPRLAERAGIDVETLIRRHCDRDYHVFALGFAPGYAFMGLVDESLAAPRLKTPRQRVAAGSVGIADRQTAIYPLRSPGGWNILGRSPAALFDRDKGESLMHPGDRVRFIPVTRSEFESLGGDPTPLEER